MRDRGILVVSVCLSVAYFFGFVDESWRFAVKAGSIAALGGLALLRGHQGVGIGLLLSSAGDALLDIGSRYFMAGLFAFLCAHVTYTATFLRRRDRPAWTRSGWIASAAVIAFSVAFGIWLIPGVGGLAVPVVLYLCAITAMVVSSIVVRPGLWVPVGAVLFLVSDAILAANRFKTPIPGRDFLVWSTYYVGQALIAAGYVRQRAAARETERTRTVPAEPGIASHAAGGERQ